MAKMTLLKILPEMYLLRRHDYSRFMVKDGAAGLMRDNWQAVGMHIGAAMKKVGDRVEQQELSIRKSDTTRVARPSTTESRSFID